MPKTTGFNQASEQDVHTVSDTPRAVLGTKVHTADGRVYRYARAGATALNAGEVTATPEVAATTTDLAVAETADTGSQQITVTLSTDAVEANAFAGGFVTVTDGDNSAISYKIASHDAAEAEADLVILLEDAIVGTVTAADEVTVTANEYADVVVAPADGSLKPAGVPNVDVDAGYYFWSQTGGVGAVLAHAIVAASNAVSVSGTAGAFDAAGAGDYQVGVTFMATAAGGTQPIKLTIDN